MLEGHQYAIYYDLTGTSPNTNYGFTIRLVVNSFVTGTLATLSQTAGADASGTFIFTVPSGGSGYPCFVLGNNVGQSISGDIYIYDITGLTASQINGIDFAQVGASKVFVFAAGSSSGGGVSDWSDKKVVFYGDSITQGNYPEKVQTALGFTLVKNAIGGSRYGYIASDPSINANALSSDTRIANLPSDADVVCIMGGTNDFPYTAIEDELTYADGFDRTKFKGAVAYTIQHVQTQCPNALIYILTLIGGRGNADPSVLQPLPQIAESGAGAGNSSLDYRNAEIEVANLLNIPVIDTWSCGINGLNRNTTIRDAVHPSEKGNVMIAEYITAALADAAPW
jgi:lysophospholipase L1-like esterase